MGPRHHLSFCAYNTAWLAPESLVSMGPNPYLWFLHSKQRLLDSNNKSLRVPDITCSLVHAISVISTGIPCLYGSQPLSVVLGCTTATFGAELQVSMGPRHDLSFCGCKTAWLASEVLVSMGPSPHVWFLDAKQRLLDQNNKSLWDPALICGFCMPNSEFWPRITSLYGSQTSPAL